MCRPVQRFSDKVRYLSSTSYFFCLDVYPPEVVDHEEQLALRMEIPDVDPEAVSVDINGRYLVVTSECRLDY